MYQPPVRPTPSRGQPAKRMEAAVNNGAGAGAGASGRKKKGGAGGITRDRGAKRNASKSSLAGNNAVGPANPRRPSNPGGGSGGDGVGQDSVAVLFPGLDDPMQYGQQKVVRGSSSMSNVSTASDLFGGELRPEDRRYRKASMQGIDFKGSFRRKGLLVRSTPIVV